MTRALAAARLASLAGLASVTGCLYATYLPQAVAGQADLLVRARPIEDVIRDPETSVRTAMVLAEIGSIRTFGRSYGLNMTSKYTTYTKLNRRAAVWFVGASSPTEFAPLKFCFPIAGCFQGLGWFDEDDAIDFEAKLKKRGLDTVERPASAYSTGGYFPDPLLSTMIGGGDDTLPYFANTVLHESVHATIFIPDEPPFNESLAVYIADAMTDEYIRIQFGRGSPEDVAWTFGAALGRATTVRTTQTYKQLKALYAQHLPEKDTLAKKAAIIDALVADLKLHRRPNNATLGESNVYNGGLAVLHDAHVACGDLSRFITAAKTIRRGDFQKDLQEDISSVGAKIAAQCRR